MNASGFFIALKLLLVVMFSELLIMVSFHVFNIDMTSWWVSAIDVMLLGTITAFIVYRWIIQPLTQAQEKDALFRNISEYSHSGLVITDPNKDNEIIYTNAAFTTITGYPMAEVKGKRPSFLTHELPHQSEQDILFAAIQAEQPVHALLKNKRKDGSIFWNDLYLSPINLDGDKPRYWLGLLHDVSESKKLNMQIEHLVNAIEQADDMVCIFDAQGHIDFSNQAFAQHIGLSQTQLIGQSIWQYWCDESLTATMIQDALMQQGEWSGHNQWCSHEHTPYETMTKISTVDGHDQPDMHIAVIRDMSDEIEMSNQLAHAKKMEAVGTLAGGIAHDFNNMLAAMMGNLYLLKKQMRTDKSIVHRIETIEAQGHRGASLIRQMLIFARKQAVERQDFDLQLLAKETIKLLHTSIPENIRLDATVDATIMTVHGDPSLLQSSLFNLVNNARHAIEDNIGKTSGTDGVIHLSVAAEGIDTIPEEIRKKLIKSNNDMSQCVHIRITDNGMGMDQSTLDRVFEPYFTTKKTGHGTGLGLPMVMGCIDMHDGWIDLSSHAGVGTCVEIYLPLMISTTAIEQHDISIQPGHGELILLADDNQPLRESMCEMLKDAGYRVLAADNGEQAIQQYMRHQQEIRLVIMDCIMPKLGGVEAAQTISQHADDNMAIVLMTGYSEKAALMANEEEGNGKERPVILYKPWQIEQLNVVLQSMHVRRQNTEQDQA